MIKVYEVKETIQGSDIIGLMYSIQILIQDIIRLTESKEVVNYEDYAFINTVLIKVERALRKIHSIIKLN